GPCRRPTRLPLRFAAVRTESGDLSPPRRQNGRRDAPEQPSRPPSQVGPCCRSTVYDPRGSGAVEGDREEQGSGPGGEQAGEPRENTRRLPDGAGHLRTDPGGLSVAG